VTILEDVRFVMRDGQVFVEPVNPRSR
jgi:hypothetical protein